MSNQLVGVPGAGIETVPRSEVAVLGVTEPPASRSAALENARETRRTTKPKPNKLPGRGRLAERFWEKVDVRGANDCWPWLASSRGVGYGAFKVRGKVVDSHVVAYELAYARPLPGIWVTHKCDNRACCNPAHLVPGTPLDNYDDMVKRGRAVTPEAISERNRRLGLKPPRMPKLTDEQAALVITLAAQGWTHVRIALEVGVQRPAVSKIVAGERWPHLDRSALAGMPRRTRRKVAA